MFYFALAQELHMTVKQLLSNIDSRELSEWQAYFKAIKKGKEPDSDKMSDNIKSAFGFFSK